MRQTPNLFKLKECLSDFLNTFVIQKNVFSKSCLKYWEIIFCIKRFSVIIKKNLRFDENLSFVSLEKQLFQINFCVCLLAQIYWQIVFRTVFSFDSKQLIFFYRPMIRKTIPTKVFVVLSYGCTQGCSQGWVLCLVL